MKKLKVNMEVIFEPREHYPEGLNIKEGDVYDNLCCCTLNGIPFYTIVSRGVFEPIDGLRIHATLLNPICIES